MYIYICTYIYTYMYITILLVDVTVSGYAYTGLSPRTATDARRMASGIVCLMAWTKMRDAKTTTSSQFHADSTATPFVD